MTAVPNPAPESKSNKDLIQRFREEYKAALEDARVSAKHTETEGWQRLYAEHRKAGREKRRELAGRLGTLGKAMEDFGLTEEGEKDLKTVAKESETLRASNEVFETETVERVCAAVRACERIIEAYRNEAVRQESNAPLHNVGLEHLMREEIAKVAKPRWDSETGTVKIAE